MTHLLPNTIVLSVRFPRFVAWLIAAVLTAHFGVQTARAIEVIGDPTLPGPELTTVQILTGSVGYDVTVGGTTESADTTYPYLVYLEGADIYDNPTYLPVASGNVTVSGAIFRPAGGATAVANLSSTGGLKSLTLGNAGGGYTTPPVIAFVGGGGSGGAATVTLGGTGGLSSVAVTAAGTGYTTPPAIRFAGGGGGGAVATATLDNNGVVKGFNEVFRGAGYTSTPDVIINGGGGIGAEATAVLESTGSVRNVNITIQGSGYTAANTTVNFVGAASVPAAGTVVVADGRVVGVNVTTPGSGYTTPPIVAINGDGFGANATAVLGRAVKNLRLDRPGSGYTANPTVAFSGGDPSAPADFTSFRGFGVQSIAVDAPGSGYTSAPTVNVSGGDGTGAAATASFGLQVAGITITDPGSGYTSAPNVVFSGGGGGTGAAATATIGFSVASVAVTNGGSNYSDPPLVVFGGGGGTGVAGTAAIAGGQVTAVAVTDGGSGYTSAPTVTLSGGGGSLTEATTARVGPGNYVIPNDGTLHNITSGYRMFVRFYTPGNLPTTEPDLSSNLAIGLTSGQINIDVLPDLAVPTSPAATYRAGSYRGGDIIPFVVKWRNDSQGEGDRQSRPLKSSRTSVEDESDVYYSDLRLSMNAEFGDTGNNDFLLSRLRWGGDVPAIPDGSTVLRSVAVSGTPGEVPPYGLTGVTGTTRDYTPQPDDGFLDIGEAVSVELDSLIPRNYSNRDGFFVAVEVAMSSPDEDASSNNVFVSNSANKISILETASPTLEAASVVSTQTGEFVQGGNAASDFGSVSEYGNLITFASRATNLLNLPGGGTGPATAGQQVFLKYRQSREIELMSANLAGVQANADCFNPVISADGNYIAFDSRATNLGTSGTGDRSMIYVYNLADNSTVVVSKSAAGLIANGDSFRPQMSQSGRFVSFESLARNLDPARPLPSGNRNNQIFLHDRDVDGNGVFDEAGGTATYLVSINNAGTAANGWCNNAVVNLDDTAADIATLGGVFVAYSSYARNMPLGTGYSMIYRVTVVPGAGPVPASVVPVSVNDLGAAPVAVGVDPVAAFIRPDCDEAAINGDGSQIAFTSYASNFVRNETDGSYTPTYPNNDPANPAAPVDPAVVPAGDYNRVPDIFVRNLLKPLGTPSSRATSRVSISEPRVATGTITFLSAYPEVGNIPVNQPATGEQLTISDGISPPVTLVFGTDVAIGTTVYDTRNNLVSAINTAGLELVARATTPPNAAAPGTAYGPSIYVRNLVPGAQGNVVMTTDATVLALAGMSGGGVQAEENPGNTDLAPVQGVPFGSNQPSIDRSGRFVAFRTIATNLDVHTATDSNTFPGSPATGELIRPFIFPTSNVYLHDRLANDESTTGFDVPGNLRTRRISVNRFGYKTLIDGGQTSGINATTSANSSLPAISADGRFVTFSSDSSGEGGLIFGPNNLTPLDNTNLRDVFVSDQQTVGDNPEPPDTLPSVSIFSPLNGTEVIPGSLITVSAVAEPKGRKAIVSARCLVNGNSLGTLTSTPFEWSFTADPAGTYVVEVIATDNRGGEGSSFVQITAKQPTVPVNPPAGSNAKFVVDYFSKIFLRQPSYGEYDTYLNMLDNGSSQAETIVAMMQSPEYASAQNVLFGYLLRMGLAAPSTNVVRSYLGTMTSGTNGTLLTSTFLPMSAFAGTPPYGATIGQAAIAETLLNLVPAVGTNAAVRSMNNDTFRLWMLRSFNEPYLTQAYTNQIFSMGDPNAIVANILSVPSAISSAISRYGHNYAYMSAFYANMPPANIANSNLKTALSNFNPKVQGIALNYSLAPGNPWATNTAPLSVNLAASLLPPVITNTGTNTLTVSNSFTNVVGGQNLLSNTIYSYVATNLPSSVAISTNSGRMVISGRFTNTGTYPVTLIASNGPGLVGSNRVVYLVTLAAPILAPATVNGSVGDLLSYSVPSSNTVSSFSIGALPAGLSFNTSSGLLLGVPLEDGVLQTTLTANNSGGATQAPLTFNISAPSPMVEWLVERGLVGADALPEADPDGDGHSNTVEFAFGMRPDVADTMPVAHEFSPDGVAIRWTRRIGTAEVSYQLQQSPSMGSPSWSPVGGVVPQIVAPENGVQLPSGYERMRAFIPRPTGVNAPAALFYRVTATLTPAATAKP